MLRSFDTGNGTDNLMESISNSLKCGIFSYKKFHFKMYDALATYLFTGDANVLLVPKCNIFYLKSPMKLIFE